MNFEGAVISVGGSADPIVVSLNQARPGFVLFLVSARSKAEVEEKILPRLDFTPQYSFAEVPDETDLAKCYEAAREAIARWLKERNLHQVYVDITGATKPMSAGLAMAGAERFSHFTYVRGKERDKDGLGVVVSGTEEVFRTVNPWDKLAARERERATWLFRSYYAEAAAEQLRQAAENCGPELQQELETLAQLAECFAKVDKFDFSPRVLHEYQRHWDKLNLIFSHRQRLEIWEEIERAAQHWKKFKEEKDAGGPSILLELLANAQRRGAQSRYDDAIARLYRAAEFFAQDKLHDAFGARLGKIELASLAAELHPEWVKMFGERDAGLYKLGVQDGFKALKLSPNPEHRALADRCAELNSYLQRRNDSILAHGLRPCSQDDFRQFWSALLRLFNLSETDIPKWPAIDF
jgi:CRISPR-associated protein (TIGR02710 family)